MEKDWHGPERRCHCCRCIGRCGFVCLLFVLCALRERMGFEVKVCHVNHGIRGAEADADEAYVRQLCGKLQADCIVFHENVELIAEKKETISGGGGPCGAAGSI